MDGREADGKEGCQGGKEVWRRRLHTNLHRLFLVTEGGKRGGG